MYQVVLVHARPFHYYSRIYFVGALIITGLSASAYADLGPHAGSVVVAIMNVLNYLMLNYDNAIISSVVPPDIVGFVFGFQGCV